MMAGNFSQTDRRVLGLLSFLLVAGVVFSLYKRNSRPVSPAFLLSALEVPSTNFAGRPLKNQNPLFAPVDLNRAGAEELERLPGLGPVLARRILDYREKKGDFKTVQELLRVPGIGPKKLAEIKIKVCVTQAADRWPAEALKGENPQSSVKAWPNAPMESSFVSSKKDLR